MPDLLHVASLWSLRQYPGAQNPWTIDQQLDAIRVAGFGGVTGRINPSIGQAAQDRGLAVVGFVSLSGDAEFGPALETQKLAGARYVNVQLGDHDTPAKTALQLALRLFETAEHLGGLEIAVEVHRDTCTETPEKTYALADAYQRATGRQLPMTWDFSHFAVVKHLTAKDFTSRLLVRPDLIQRSNQFHFRPFNGHHCQVPVTRHDGQFTRELIDWIPFALDTFLCWLEANGTSDRILIAVPEMGPVSSGYNLEGLPNSWEDAVRLRPLLEELWQEALNEQTVRR
ncbi:MAG: xylose isomerase [Verrucomicrobia bacterium]|nr:xylose isomerase [Verrucomicrobiota bacterium]